MPSRMASTGCKAAGWGKRSGDGGVCGRGCGHACHHRRPHGVVAGARRRAVGPARPRRRLPPYPGRRARDHRGHLLVLTCKESCFAALPASTPRPEPPLRLVRPNRSSLRRGSCGTRPLRGLKQSSLPPRLRSSQAAMRSAGAPGGACSQAGRQNTARHGKDAL